MLDDAKTPESPGWWLLRLGTRLNRDAQRFDRLEAYWRGDPPMPHGNKRMREAYRRLQRLARTNFGALVVESLLERMKVVAFRTGSDGSTAADKAAWNTWWQANSLDAEQGLVHRAAVMMSRSYVIVGRDPEDDTVMVTGEDPRQVIHESSPTNRRKVRAAVKCWWDDIGGCYRAALYLPDRIHYFVTVDHVSQETPGDAVWSPASWCVDTSDPDFPDGFGVNELGSVPVVPFVNRPDMAGGGLGEYEDTLDILDRINNVILDRLVISAMQAYRQRWATGLKVEDDEGNSAAEFDPGADMLWAVEDEKAKFGDFQPTDLTPILKAAEADVQHLAAITRTPPHYLLGTMINTSGDALAVAETGLVSKLLERETEFGESWEQVYRHAARLAGEDVAADCEVVWKSPQFRTLTELASANVQLQAAGVPWRTRMEWLDVSPSQIDRMDAERHADALLSATLAPLSIAEGGQLGTRGASTGAPATGTAVPPRPPASPPAT